MRQIRKEQKESSALDSNDHGEIDHITEISGCISSDYDVVA